MGNEEVKKLKKEGPQTASGSWERTPLAPGLFSPVRLHFGPLASRIVGK